MSSFLMASPYPQDYVWTDFPLLKSTQDDSQPVSTSSVLQQRVADSYSQYVHSVTPTAHMQSYLSGPMMMPYQTMTSTSNDPSNLSSLHFDPVLQQQIPHNDPYSGSQQMDPALSTSPKQVELPSRSAAPLPVPSAGPEGTRDKIEQQQQQAPTNSSAALVPASRTNDRGRRGLKISIPRTPVLYSESGFDMMGILSRVASRPNPQVTIGPVDFTCSFVVADARLPEEPIVYASPTFSELTGYELPEIMGRNCRFLQAPHGIVRKGETRRFTDDKAVGHIRKSLDNRQECQVSFINYRKNGDSFINLVTVIPIKWREGDDTDSDDEGDEDQYRYLVGFQVDLERQPNAILRTMRDGTYSVNYSMAAGVGDRSDSRYPPIAERLRKILSGTAPPTTTEQEREKLNTLILEQSDDFIHVLSLKGSIQYVSPSVRAVLEYDPEELSGKTISDITHPSDVVPVLRELKESSLPSAHSSGSNALNFASTLLAQHYMHQARLVHLLFRVRRRYSGYIWIESTGRLQVEPGKGRKSLVFSGRIRRMPRLELSDLASDAGLADIISGDFSSEIWSQISVDGGLFLVVSTGAKDVLGTSAQEVMGTRLSEWLSPESRGPIERTLSHIAHNPKLRMPPTKFICMRIPIEDLPPASLLVTIYQPSDPPTEPISSSSSSQPPQISTRGQRLSVVISHIRFATPNDTSSGGGPQVSSSSSHIQEYLQQSLPPSAGPGPSSQILSSPTVSSNIFEELETTRGTSWQYELQQLRIQNEKMRKEIAAIERDQRAQLTTMQQRQQQHPQSHGSAQSLASPMHQQHQSPLHLIQATQQPQQRPPRLPPTR
ncbi:uncharacterized protein EI90DRAFT_3065882 [Cantharellus anzutake]|uniref:uncharacterized protein n=1 Tax=Cantharellus anzutake TaxID=1750568 RepID=UPI0019080365|nr:uncharacterized protein EI90DRAFT_3065882 [Cantharellus anzutake]KAF8328207.1 hypothetical protein EI90DRAFT_3065882 [Cantharellus anzutake]